MKYVIFAEDDRDDQLFLSMALEECGSEIKASFVSDGVELMTELRFINKKPDVIFLDLNMPLKSGIECLKEIRATKSIRECAVIILTTSSSASDIDLCYTCGANLFVTKPFDVGTLGRVLKRVISLVPSLRNPIDKNQFVMNTGAA